MPGAGSRGGSQIGGLVMSFEVDGEPIEAGGTGDRLLSWERVQDITGISRSTAWRMQRTGEFPSPVKVSPGRVGWWESELTAWKGQRLGAGKVRTPAARPRLPGMARSMPTRAEPGRAGHTKPGPASAAAESEPSLSDPASLSTTTPVQAVLPLQAPSTGTVSLRTSGRKRRACPDQIDFGF